MQGKPASGCASVDAAGFALVVLDLDGTLVRLPVDWPRVHADLAAVARGHGLIPEGPGILTLLHQARALGRTHDAGEMEALLRRAEWAAADRCEKNTCLIAWVHALPPALPITILSVNSRQTVQRALTRVDLCHRIAAAVGREDVRCPKPHPEGLFGLLDRYQVAPEKALFIGDSDADRECGARAGVTTLPVAAIGTVWAPCRPSSPHESEGRT